MRFVSDTDSFGKDTEGGCHVQMILASFFFFLAYIGIHFTKRHEKTEEYRQASGV